MKLTLKRLYLGEGQGPFQGVFLSNSAEIVMLEMKVQFGGGSILVGGRYRSSGGEPRSSPGEVWNPVQWRVQILFGKPKVQSSAGSSRASGHNRFEVGSLSGLRLCLCCVQLV
jgi:hypothetical protein